MFTGDKMKSFIRKNEIKLIHSSPYYAQTNSQVETTNKVLIDMIEGIIEDQPRK